MRKLILAVLIGAVLMGGAYYLGAFGGRTAGGRTAGGGARAGGGGGGGALVRPPMTVELARVARGDVSEHLTVVGNLIGAATVEVAPKISGRLRSVTVRLGDAVSRGQVIAQIEDNEIREQVKQAEASFEVAAATIRQREADLKFAETSLERSRNLYNRQLLPRQTLDDNDARYQAAVAQLDLARAQYTQARSRLDELRLTLGNTIIVSPVDGFVGRRYLDPGAFVGSNTPVASVVDIRLVRLVVNLVERDLRRVQPGAVGTVVVDAFPDDTFEGRIARIAPVLDPATRTAEMEIEIPNRDYRLKPGMYARVQLTTGTRTQTLVVPRNALVEIDGRRGVFVPHAAERDGGAPAAAPAGQAQGGGRPAQQARFVPVEIGLQDANRVEVVNGLSEQDSVITTGAGGLRDGDPIVVAAPRGAGRPGPRAEAGRRPAGGPPAAERR